MNHLNSFSSYQQAQNGLIELINQMDFNQNDPKNSAYIVLGIKNLSTIIADILYFKLQQKVKYPTIFIQSDLSNIIANKLLKAENPRKLQICLGKIYQQMNLQKIKLASQSIKLFIQLYIQEVNKSKINSSQSFQFKQFKQSNTVSNILSYKQNGFEILSDISKLSYQTVYNQIPEENKKNSLNDASITAFDFFDTMNQSYDKQEEIHKHIQQVHDFFKKPNNASTIMNLLCQFKINNVFKVQDEFQKNGCKTIHTVILKFKNFLNNGEIVEIKDIGEAQNKKNAKQIANLNVLTKFFIRFPYVFRDFLCQKRLKE